MLRLVASIFFLIATSIATASPVALPSEMQSLCKKSDVKKFTPRPESIKSPQANELFRAIELGAKDERVLKLLNGQQADGIIINSVTPMHIAALSGNWPAARALISSGADVNFGPTNEKDTYQLRPLNAAMLTSQFSFACKLIQNGATLPTKESERKRLMEEALIMEPGFFQDGSIFIEYLLKQGFDVNDSNNSLATPLMAAVAQNNIPTIKVLLKHGARLDIVKNGDRTVWGIAYEKNNKQVLKLLDTAQKREFREMEKQSTSPTSR